ncbi:hypothetical protein MMC31_004197 [Peltigera leucophlebia]|nr:hypothetical protein [Peltigera leucophlebia]
MAGPKPGIYKIKSTRTQAKITLTGGQGSELSAWANHTGQHWQIAHLGNEEYLLISNETGLLISAEKGENQPATAQFQPPSKAKGRWTFEDRGSDGYRIHNVANPEQVIDLSWGKFEDGTPILAFGQNDRTPHNQDWHLEAV